MTRPRPAALTVALALIAAAGAAMALPGPAAPGTASAALAAQAARAPVTVTLDSGTVEWRVAPYADVGAWWYAGDSFSFNTFGSADSTGRVVLTWTDPTPERTDDDRPFDGLTRLVLGTGVDRREAYTVTLPALDAEVDAPGDRVAVRGPAGATLAVRIRRAVDRDILGLTAATVVSAVDKGVGGGALAGERASGEPGRSAWAGTITTDRDGAAEVRLAGTLDVQPGDTVEVQRVFAGDAFVLRRTAFQLVLGQEQRQPLAYGRPGAAVALKVRGADGRTRDCPATIGLTGRSAWSCGAAIAAGDRVSVTHTGRLLPPTRAAATLPGLSYHAAAGSVPAAVAGPPNGRLRLAEVDALGGPSGIDVALDAQGSAVLPAGRPARGSRFAYAWRHPDGITWGLGGYVPQIRIVLGEPRLRGVWPAAAVTVTVESRDGQPLAGGSQRTWDGSTRPIALYGLRPGPRGGLHRLGSGERVEVVIGGDEPVVFTVPDLGLVLDDARGRLTGRLPAGTRGTLTVIEPVDGDTDPLRALDDLADRRFAHRATLALNAAPDGVFEVALTGLRDADGFRLPNHRLVLYVIAAERPDGHAYMAVVARPWLRIDAQSVIAEGFGPSAQAVEVEVADAAGRPVARARGLDPDAMTADRPIWRAPIVDAVGAATALRPGDRVTVTVGASRSVVTVPPMEAYVDLPGRAVRGRSAPNAAFTVALYSETFGGRRWIVRAGPDGAFQTPLPTDFPLRMGDWADTVGRVGSHLVTAQVVVPSMTVDLSVGRIWGRGVAGLPVDVTLLRRGQPIAAGRRVADDWLGYNIDPHDPRGVPVRPAAGDVIVQRVAGRPPFTVTVPELSARWAPVEEAIVGTAPPDSRVDVLRRAGFALTSAEWNIGSAAIDPTGAFSAPAGHARGLKTGLDAVLLARVPSGESVLRWVTTPVLNIPHGGDSVCGLAQPWARVHAEVTSGGGAAEGDGVADESGRFRIPLRRADGRPVTLAAGDVVHADVDGTALEATLPALTFRIDRVTGRGRGTAPPGATVSIEHPSNSCAPEATSDPVGDVGYLYTNPTTADNRGAFDASLPTLPGDLAATRPPAYEAAILDGAGHRHFRLNRALRMTALVDTDRVLGEADAGRTVAVSLLRPGGLSARANAVADAVGHFSATLTTDGGGAVRLQSGDQITASADAETRGLTIPPLAVDWHPERGLEGRTDAGATVHVRFTLPRGLLLAQDTDVTFALNADATGRFASAAAPGRGAWTPADVRRVEVWRSFEEDDRAMVAFDLAHGAAPTPGATAGPPGGLGIGRALLPWAGRGANRP